MNVRLVRLFGWFGIAAPVIGVLGTVLTVTVAPSFSWGGNSLADLGLVEPASMLFLATLRATSGAMMAFSAGVFEWAKDDKVGQAGFVLNFAAAALLFLVSMPEISGVQGQLATAFFACLPVSLLVLAYHMREKGMRTFSYLSFACGFVGLAVWAPQWGGHVIQEAVSFAACGVWSVALGWWMTRREEQF